VSDVDWGDEREGVTEEEEKEEEEGEREGREEGGGEWGSCVTTLGSPISVKMSSYFWIIVAQSVAFLNRNDRIKTEVLRPLFPHFPIFFLWILILFSGFVPHLRPD